MREFILKEDLLIEIAKYLGQCPYAHVRDIVSGLEKLQEIETPESIKEKLGAEKVEVINGP